MIIGVGIPSKIKPCGQIYKDSKTGLKYHQSKCPQGNDWNLIDSDISNDSSGGGGTMPTGLGETIYYQNFTLSYDDMMDSFNTPILLTSITNSNLSHGSPDAAIVVLQISSIFSGTKFSNSNLYMICQTPNTAYLSYYGIALLNYNTVKIGDNTTNPVFINWDLNSSNSETIQAGNTHNLYFTTTEQLTGGDDSSQMTIYLSYTLNS